MRFSSLCVLCHGCMPILPRRGLSATPLLSFFLIIIILLSVGRNAGSGKGLDANVPPQRTTLGNVKMYLPFQFSLLAVCAAGTSRQERIFRDTWLY
jgi:hypothetical protein